MKMSTYSFSMFKKFLVIFLLGFSSGLPLALVTSTLQAWFAESAMSVFVTGSLSLVGLPYVYRFLLAPLLDRFSLSRLGKRRSWLLILQSCLLLGLNAMAWLSPAQTPMVMFFLAMFLALCSASQDSVIDAHRIEYLSDNEQGLGASLADVGYRLALLLSGGIGLIMAAHWGFTVVYRWAGALMTVGMLTTYLSREPFQAVTQVLSFSESFVIPFQQIGQRPLWLCFLCFIFFYKLGEAFTASTSGIVMPFFIQGLGFSLETIGIVNKIVGTVAVVFGGVVAGFVLLRYQIYRILWFFGILQVLANGLFVFLAIKGQNIHLLSTAVVMDNLAAGMGSTALVALLMRWVDRRFTATQFSLLVSVAMLPRTLSGWIAGSVQPLLGWVGLYELSVILALLFAPFLWQMRHVINGLHGTEGRSRTFA